jgi:hypothetical protein
MKDQPTHTLVFQGWDAVMELHMAATQGYGIFLPLNCSLNLLTYNYFNVHTSVNKVALFFQMKFPFLSLSHMKQELSRYYCYLECFKKGCM